MNFEIGAELRDRKSMVQVLLHCISTRGIINKNGGFFETAWDQASKDFKYEAPWGCFQLVAGEGDRKNEAVK